MSTRSALLVKSEKIAFKDLAPIPLKDATPTHTCRTPPIYKNNNITTKIERILILQWDTGYH